jgi:tRNA-splicing ligase RtcB
MIYYDKGKNLVKIWDKNVGDNTMEQIKNVSNLPFIYKHVAIMADNHFGFGCPIGTVLATKDVVVPNLTGVDIGCGLCAVKTSLTDINTDTLKKIMGEIRKVIPVGFSKHQEKQNKELMPKIYLPLNTIKNIIEAYKKYYRSRQI